MELEKIIFKYENTPDTCQQDIYESAKNEYDQILREITIGHILRTKTVDYQSSEKHSKYFLNLEKNRAINSTIRRLCINPENEIETTNKQTIMNEIKNFYKNLYSTVISEADSCTQFFNNITLPTLTADENNILNQPISMDDLKASIKKSKNGKSPGSDGLTREFYIVFGRTLEKCCLTV